MVGFSGGGPAGCDRGRVGQQQEQHGGVGQRSQRQADHGEDVQRVRTPVRPGRRLTTGQFPTPRRIRSRRRCPTCWASVRTMASPRSPVGPGRCRTRGRRRTDWRSGDCAARAGRAGSEVFGDQFHQRERDIGDPRRPCRGGAAQHPGGPSRSGGWVARRCEMVPRPAYRGAAVLPSPITCSGVGSARPAPAHPPLQGRPGRRRRASTSSLSRGTAIGAAGTAALLEEHRPAHHAARGQGQSPRSRAPIGRWSARSGGATCTGCRDTRLPLSWAVAVGRRLPPTGSSMGGPPIGVPGAAMCR